MTEVRHSDRIELCPECQLAATRRPALDQGEALAFQCENRHRVFYVTPAEPARVKTVAAKDEVSAEDAPHAKHTKGK